jgi:hypothetical protein
MRDQIVEVYKDLPGATPQRLTIPDLTAGTAMSDWEPGQSGNPGGRPIGAATTPHI